jgi:hypothetical protein
MTDFARRLRVAIDKRIADHLNAYARGAAYAREYADDEMHALPSGENALYEYIDPRNQQAFDIALTPGYVGEHLGAREALRDAPNGTYAINHEEGNSNFLDVVVKRRDGTYKRYHVEMYDGVYEAFGRTFDRLANLLAAHVRARPFDFATMPVHNRSYRRELRRIARRVRAMRQMPNVLYRYYYAQDLLGRVDVLRAHRRRLDQPAADQPSTLRAMSATATVHALAGRSSRSLAVPTWARKNIYQAGG